MCDVNRYVEDHFNEFLNCLDVQEAWPGSSPRDWTNQVADGDWGHLPNERLNRQQLKDFCRDERFTDVDCVFTIMAWGGMRRDHGRRLASNIERISNVVADLRNGRMTASEAYAEFFEATITPIGIRPAYYTKLVFFLDPNSNGYIMDQWTAKSINLLTGERLVKLEQGNVSKDNPQAVYDAFCQEIRCIGSLTEREPDQIEMALFSQGQNRGVWRQYVIENWIQ